MKKQRDINAYFDRANLSASEYSNAKLDNGLMRTFKLHLQDDSDWVKKSIHVGDEFEWECTSLNIKPFKVSVGLIQPIDKVEGPLGRVFQHKVWMNFK